MSNVNWENFIEQLKSRNDIVEVISSYINVIQKGSSFMASCPFHGERTPSFSIRPQGQYYKCFGCGKGGDVISFVMEYENCDFMSAVEILAKRANMAMPESGQNDAVVVERNRKRKVALDICTESAKFYHRCLNSAVGQEARRYLIKRGLLDQTILTFGLGYSPDYESLPAHLTGKGYSSDDCCTAGVLAEQHTSKRLYDVMSGRLIVPILNVQGQVVGFGGRVLDAQSSPAKYKNTAETIAFEKTKNLFGLNLVRKIKATQTIDSIIMLEGYMDVMSMYQAGYVNCVASMGTMLTKEQAKLLARYANTVYICYDGDSAGRAATLRGLDILKEQSLSIYVVSLPDKLDPDDYVRKYGKTAFDKLLEQALPLVDYKLKLLEQTYPIDHTDKNKRNQARIEYAKKAVEILQRLDDVERQAYVETVALRSGFEKQFILDRLSTAPKDGTYEEQLERETTPLDKREKALCFIARSHLYNRQFISAHFNALGDNEFFNKIFNYCLRCQSEDKQLNPSMAYDFASTDREKLLSKQIVETEYEFDSVLDEEQYYQDCIKTYQELELRELRSQIQRKMQLTDQDELRNQYTEQIFDITEKIKLLRKKKED